METVMTDLMFELPSHKNIGRQQTFTVTKAYAEEKLGVEKMIQLRNAG
jgi:hypothetical protein